MAYTAQDLINIDAAIARGATTIKIADREVTYRSQSELLQLRKLIKGELDAAEEPAAVPAVSGGRTFLTAYNGRGY